LKKQTFILGAVLFAAAFAVGVMIETNKPRHFMITDDTLANAGVAQASPVPADMEKTMAPAETVIPGEPVQQAVKEKININTAAAEELDKLDGIGEKIAERIIKYREEHGAFEVIEDIMKVSGIGEKKFADIKDDICVE